ncbi:MAG: NAD-dependent epimerase/dehydratase family protein [Rubricoccaceae bacterium]
MSAPLAFVTGGTGFVGSHLVEELLRRGVQVRALVRASPKWIEGLDVELVTGDLHDTNALANGVDGAQYVYHVAGLTRARDQETLDAANVNGTLVLLETLRQHASDVQKVLVTSSLEAMGPNRLTPDGSALPAIETDVPEPISMYGRSKARMEAEIQKQFSDLPVVIVRPPAVYGPREADIFEIVKGASRGLFAVVGRSDVPRLSLVHVRDLVRGMVELAESDGTTGETYFVGTRGYSWDEVRQAMERALGRRSLRLPVPSALIGAAGALAEVAGRATGSLPPLTRDKAEAAKHTWICASSKAEAAVGYAPEIGLGEGMAETVSWYRDAGWLR